MTTQRLHALLVAHLLLITAACAQADDTSAAAGPVEVAEYTIEQFMGSTSYGGSSFSPDGEKILVRHNGSGIFNVYSVAVDGGEAVQLTSSETDGNFAVSYFRSDERFLYRADQGGNELNHVYVQDPDGQVTDLTPGENHTASFAGWTSDGSAFFLQSNERDPQAFDLYRYDAESYDRAMVFKNTEGFFPGPLSRDGGKLTLIRVMTTNDTDVWVQDLASGERTHITPHEGDVKSGPADFTPDGSALLYTTDEGREFQALMRYDLASGEKTVVADPPWDVQGAGYSRDGRYLVVSVNADARTDLQVLDASTMEEVTLPAVPDADIVGLGFSADDSEMAFYASSSRRPADLYVQGLGGGGSPSRLTNSLHADIDAGHLVDAKVVRFESYDGLEIPGVLYKPHGASSTNQVPALVWVHGGPGGQSRLGYNGIRQYLVNHGYVVYAINNRGSSGYGKTFFAADDQRHGEADLGDVVASKEMLAATGYVDPARIGIIGGSYGGYMVLAALTLQPEEFEVGVDLFGISNWVRTLENIPPWWGARRDALYAELGDPTTDRERLEWISPIFNADKIVRPLMVLQGANDPRVLQVESDDIVEAARANGVPVEYVVFPDEGHGFRNRDNRITGYRAILDFLNEHLVAGG